MKAILEFDLSEPEEVEAHLRCIHAADMASALMEISNIWTRFKHREEELTGEEVLKIINQIIDESNLYEIIN